MPASKLAALSLVAIVALGTIAVFADDMPTVDPKIAGMTADQKVDARRAAMREDGKSLGGALKLSGADAVKMLDTVLQNFTNFPALFADGATNSKSHALPIVWTQFDDFTAIFDKGKADVVAMRDAATKGDKAAYLDAFKHLGGVCGECHQTYRAPL